MCHAQNEKRGEDKLRKTLEEKEKYKYLGVLESDTIKQTKMKEKNKKRVPQKNEKTTRNQARQLKSYQR